MEKNFRMSRKLFHEPLDDLISHSSSNNLSPNRRIIPVNKKLAITLYFLRGTGGVSLLMAASVFDAALSTAWKHSGSL